MTVKCTFRREKGETGMRSRESSGVRLCKANSKASGAQFVTPIVVVKRFGARNLFSRATSLHILQEKFKSSGVVANLTHLVLARFYARRVVYSVESSWPT